ncbi:CDP-diacylglycerol--glycerol-3-phosphate 3-phosphatidyltransferase [Maioricimonas rarisocia]|uniref:CDP-diacylglycerol--glycerol-3-phosphate 3-phosphatidyltransferase n=1 Tax=Maioricimonas rarisocia TaxID=2528026 RepID=A0A517ZG00_9PLAN|nr:CDP-alcohol phosphatidyltransferase family protein [Maioricimonas rarisocia]QDU41406.1 CDP-diacylglycerol--glycerol-3-phosphate 3-phosphatidyltransferase [Maioricimonas rarisocia]
MNTPESVDTAAHPAGADRTAPLRILFWLLANGLTLLRLLAGLAYPLSTAPWRVILLIYAAISDLIDGEVSRRLGVASMTGQILDPIADKVFVLAVLFTLLFEGNVTALELLFIGARDFSVLAVAVIAVTIHPQSWTKMPSRISGKLATAGQFLFLLNAVVWPPLVPGLVWAAGLLSCAAGIDYVLVAFRTAPWRQARLEAATEETQ